MEAQKEESLPHSPVVLSVFKVEQDYRLFPPERYGSVLQQGRQKLHASVAHPSTKTPV